MHANEVLSHDIASKFRAFYALVLGNTAAFESMFMQLLQQGVTLIVTRDQCQAISPSAVGLLGPNKQEGLRPCNSQQPQKLCRSAGPCQMWRVMQQLPCKRLCSRASIPSCLSWQECPARRPMAPSPLTSCPAMWQAGEISELPWSHMDAPGSSTHVISIWILHSINV